MNIPEELILLQKHLNTLLPCVSLEAIKLKSFQGNAAAREACCSQSIDLLQTEYANRSHVTPCRNSVDYDVCLPC